MPDVEMARCITCGKVMIVDWRQPENQQKVVDLGGGVQVVGIDEVDPDDPPMYWPDGMALGSCPIHTMEENLAAFNKYPYEHWIEGKNIQN